MWIVEDGAMHQMLKRDSGAYCIRTGFNKGNDHSFLVYSRSKAVGSGRSAVAAWTAALRNTFSEVLTA